MIFTKKKRQTNFSDCAAQKNYRTIETEEKIKIDEVTKSYLITCLGFSKLALKMIAYSKTMQSCSHTTVKYI